MANYTRRQLKNYLGRLRYKMKEKRIEKMKMILQKIRELKNKKTDE
jgi:predicted solute-binding protein